MKATGIVRRIDDLGRIVIPKEIRRRLHVDEGDPLEIFIEDDVVCLKKYEVTESYLDAVKQLRRNIADDPDIKSQKDIAQKLDEIATILTREKDGDQS